MEAERVKNVSKTEFLESYSLFSPADFSGDWSFPNRLALYCEVEERNYRLELRFVEGIGHWEAGMFAAVARMNTRSFISTTIPKKHKIYNTRQHPEPVVVPKGRGRIERISPALQTGIGCFNHGYGIGAVAYFRRVVEERTDELIDVVAELAAASGEATAEVAKITAAKSERTYDKKLEVASAMIPASLRPGGINPLGRLHSLLSEALHTKPEEES